MSLEQTARLLFDLSTTINELARCLEAAIEQQNKLLRRVAALEAAAVKFDQAGKEKAYQAKIPLAPYLNNSAQSLGWYEGPYPKCGEAHTPDEEKSNDV